MDGDIKKAYEYASHTLFAEAARSRGMHEVLIHAWLREWRSMKSVLKLDSQTTGNEVDRTRSFPHGDPAAPVISNLVLGHASGNFHQDGYPERLGQEAAGRQLGQPHFVRGQLLVGGHLGEDAMRHDQSMAGTSR